VLTQQFLSCPSLACGDDVEVPAIHARLDLPGSDRIGRDSEGRELAGERPHGPDLMTLYVTTAARGAAHEPLAGALFACRPGVAGFPAAPFAG
jgi:hypothetical protein